MIIPDDYWMGRDAAHADELTDEIRDHCTELLGRVNLLLGWAYRDGVRPALDARSGTHVASGWRPKAINDAIANAAHSSRHLTGEAIDLRDNGTRDLATWCLKNTEALREIGLWMENPRWTGIPGGGNWVHLQSTPPKSRMIVYVPSTKPPTDPGFMFDETKLS